MSDDRGEDVTDKLNEEARDWLVRLSSGKIEERDLADFKAWIDCSVTHRRAFEYERQFWQSLGGLSGASIPTKRKSLLVGRRSFLGGAAATALVTIAYPRISLLFKADFRTAPGEQKLVQLPDGSTALLNTDTAISLSFTAALRSVRLLQGEAQFNATPEGQRAFKVVSQSGYSQTDDASFAVMAVDDVTTVTVLGGAVQVVAPADAVARNGHIEIQLNQQTSYSGNSSPSAPIKVDPETELAWRRGRLIFTGRPFGRAVRDVARYLPEKVILANMEHDSVPVSAAFSTHDALSALQALATTQGLSVHRVPGIAVIIS